MPLTERCSVLETQGRRVQHLIDKARSKFMNSAGLAFRKGRRQLAQGALQLLLAQCINALAQVADGTNNAERAQPALDRIHLLGENRLHALDLLLAAMTPLPHLVL